MKKIIIITLFILGIILPNINVKAVSIGGINVDTINSGDGLYIDSYESGRYIYRGQNPNNYIKFNGELWRIIAKEADGTYKIIRNDLLDKMPFDNGSHRHTQNNTYCTEPSRGCGVYAAVDGIFKSQSNLQSGTVTEDSSIKEYLNDDYYVNNINEIAKKQILSHSFNIGAVEYLDDASQDSIERNQQGEGMYTWTGNVGLANVTDILKASINPLCTSATTSGNVYDSCNNNYLLDRGSNDTLYYWTINASYNISSYSSSVVWGASAINNWGVYIGPAGVAYSNTYNSPRPVVFLKSDVKFCGSGTESNPYIVSDKCSNENQEEQTDSTNIDGNTENNNNQGPEVVEVPSTSAYGSIIIAVLGIICVIVSVFVMRRVTKKEN